MIADRLIQAVEKNLDEKLRVDIVPFDEAYPTSGRKFVRLNGSSNSIVYQENTVQVTIGINVTSSIRIGTNQIQNQNKPYLELVDIAESIYFYLLTSNSLLSELRLLFPNPISLVNRFTSGYLNLSAIAVGADFYSSKQNSDRFIHGMKLEQEFFSPIINIPLRCGQLPDSLQELLFPNPA